MGRLNQTLEIDAGVEARTRQHVHKIFRRDVSGRVRREGTAPHAPDARIECGDACHHGCIRIRDSCIPRVVEMAAQRNVRDGFAHSLDYRGDLRRYGDADRVSNCDFDGRRLCEPLRDLDDPRDRHFAFERATECDRNRNLRADGRCARERPDFSQALSVPSIEVP
jgi:hypothetical protein